MSSTDAELVQAACDGQIDSFRQLYERHYAMAVGVARSRLSDHHLAEDAAQEAFAVACQQLHTLKDQRRFPQWLGTICRRTASKFAKLRGRESALLTEPESTGSPESEKALASTSASASSSASAAAIALDDRNERVHRALKRLSAAGREVIQLHYFSGLSYEEMGRVLGVSSQAIHGRLQRARRLLASWLSQND